MRRLTTETTDWGVLPASPDTGVSGAQALQISNEQDRVTIADATLPPPPFESPITPNAQLTPIWALWFQLVRKRMGGAIAQSPADIELLNSFVPSSQSAQCAQGLNDRGILGSFKAPDLPTLYNAIRFAMTPSVVPVDGLTYWDAAERTLATTLDAAAGVTLQHGQELHIRVVNKTGATIPNGSIVYATGVQGNRPTVALAIANDFTKCKGIAIATQDILDNQEGFCSRFGVVRGVNTFGLPDAAMLYLSETVPGAWQTTIPASPNFSVNIGIALNSTINGSIYFRPYQPTACDATFAAPGTNQIPPTQKAVKDYAVSLATAQTITGIKKFGTDTDFTTFEADGTMQAAGAATCYRDELNDLIKASVNNPSSRLEFDFTEAALKFKTNAVITDYAIMNVQLNHDWKLGSPVSPHIHWWQTENNVPNWLLQYRFQANGQAKTTAWTSLKWVNNKFPYVSGSLNQITDFGDINPPANYSISQGLQLRFIRDTANASGLFAGADPFTTNASSTAADVHIQVDTLGSRQMYSK